MLSIEVTTKCNLKCLNCFAHDDGAKFGCIDYETTINILDEGRTLGYTRLSLTGGEPFLWSKIMNLISYARDVGYTYIFINSNGHLFDENLCYMLSLFGSILHISCTLNGNKEEHDTIRGEGSYNKALAGIKVALENNLNIYIYTVVTKKNLDSIPRFTADLFQTFPKIQSLIFIQLRGIEDEYYNVTDLKLSPSDFIKLIKMIGYLSLGGFNVQILENPLGNVVAGKLELTWFPKSPEISRPGKIVVLQDNTVTFNHSAVNHLGEYSKGCLSGILSSEVYKNCTGGESLRCKGCKFIKCCREAGKLRPSSRYHNVGDSRYFCQKVLELLNE